MPKTNLRSGPRDSFPVDRKLPAAEQVYQGLREAILTCRLEPNEAISENRLCGLFGVSRSPVRTAITRLAEDGLIDIFPQRGTFVAPIKLRQVREAQFARSAMEVALAGEAAKHWRDGDTKAIRANLEDQKRHSKARDVWGFHLDNETFHQIIARAARLEGVWSTVQSVKAQWDRIGHLANRVPAHTEIIIDEHRKIAQALEKRDAKAAAAAMKLHIKSVDHAIARLRPDHGDYFVEG
jgi:GntR family transcriptional regulator, rspAB operon transcriptional repressor